MPEVLDYLAGERHISTSKLQRVFSIGYNRAANLIDTLEAKHLVSAAKGAKRAKFTTHKQRKRNIRDDRGNLLFYWH